MEHRRHLRHRCALHVAITLPDGRTGTGVVRNYSMGGMFIESTLLGQSEPGVITLDILDHNRGGDRSRHLVGFMVHQTRQGAGIMLLDDHPKRSCQLAAVNDRA